MKCYNCGGPLVYERRHLCTEEYKGFLYKVYSLGYWCLHCDEGILEGKDLIQNDQDIAAWKRSIDDLVLGVGGKI